jgi:hypothetical protein
MLAAFELTLGLALSFLAGYRLKDDQAVFLYGPGGLMLIHSAVTSW